ncbi:hypothetical protein Tco_1146025 [Tanacetum coccineum]
MLPKEEQRGDNTATTTLYHTVMSSLQALIDQGVAAALARNVMQAEVEMAITAMVQEPAEEGKFASCTLKEVPLSGGTPRKGSRQRCCIYNAMDGLEKESTKVERYVGGLPDMIHGSVKASKPQSMQEAIEFAMK